VSPLAEHLEDTADATRWGSSWADTPSSCQTSSPTPTAGATRITVIWRWLMRRPGDRADHRRAKRSARLTCTPSTHQIPPPGPLVRAAAAGTLLYARRPGAAQAAWRPQPLRAATYGRCSGYWPSQGCGSEAVALTGGDVDLIDGVITIRYPKFDRCGYAFAPVGHRYARLRRGADQTPAGRTARSCVGLDTR
jgi:hypothetical protein